MEKVQKIIYADSQSLVVLGISSSILIGCWLLFSSSRPEFLYNTDITAPSFAEASPTAVPQQVNFVVYPNPAHGLVNIEWSGPSTGTVIPVEVLGISSAEAFTIFLPAEEHIQQVNVTDWPAGTYQLLLGSGDMLARREIVIE